MQLNGKWQRIALGISIPAAAVVLLGAQIDSLCACLHPGLVAISPQSTQDLSAAKSRPRVEEALKAQLRGRYENYCPAVEADQIRCTFVFKEQYFGLRQAGQILTIRFDDRKELKSVQVDPFDRLTWHSK